MRNLIFLVIFLPIFGCQSDFEEGYQKGQKSATEQSAKVVEKIREEAKFNREEAHKNLVESQKILDEAKKTNDEIENLKNLWQAATLPDLVIARGFVDVPIPSVWAIPFLLWVLLLLISFLWLYQKMSKKSKPTPQELEIIENAKKAKEKLEEIKESYKKQRDELMKILKEKEKIEEEMRFFMAFFKIEKKEKEKEISILRKKIENLKKEINELAI